MYGVRVRELGFIYNNHTPRFDFIVPPGREDVSRAIWNCIAGGAEWDVLKLCQVPEGSALLDQAPRVAAERGWQFGCWP